MHRIILRATISRHVLPPYFQVGENFKQCRISCKNSRISHRKAGFPVPEKGQFPMGKRGVARLKISISQSGTLASFATCLLCHILASSSALSRGYGATAARLTPDQKVGSSNLSGLIFLPAKTTPKALSMASDTSAPKHTRQQWGEDMFTHSFLTSSFRKFRCIFRVFFLRPFWVCPLEPSNLLP